MAASTRDFSPGRVRELLSPFLRGGNDEKAQPNENVTDTNVDTSSCPSNEEASDHSSPKFSVCISSHRDREAYLSRVRSYSSLTWFAKPEWLCPLQCARYGWENAGSDLLQCVACRTYMSGRSPSTMQPQVYDDYCRRLEGLLVKKHHSMCPWRTNPVPESLMSVPVLGYSEATSRFLSTVHDLLTKKEMLPRLPLDALHSQGLTSTHSEKLKSLYLKLSKQGDHSSPELNKEHSLNPDGTCTDQLSSASILAVCGWKARSSSLKMIVCEDCNREVGLWNFLSFKDMDKITSDSSETDILGADGNNKVLDSNREGQLNTEGDEKSPEDESSVQEVSTSSSSPPKEGPSNELAREGEHSSEEPVKKKTKTKDTPKTKFNPLTEHRSWCPWIATGPPQKCLTVRQQNTSTTSRTTSSPSQVDTISSTSPPIDALTNLSPPEGASPDTGTVGESLEETGDWPGWQHRLQSLLPELSPEKSIRALARKSPRHASLRCIRELMYGWVSPLSDSAES